MGQEGFHHILVPWTYNTMGGQQGGPPDSTFHGAGRKRGREDHTYAKRFPQIHPRTFAAWSEFLPLSAATPNGVRPILSSASTAGPWVSMDSVDLEGEHERERSTPSDCVDSDYS